jgi:hypothetical protein
MSFDLQRILENKAAHRRKLADLPIGEKLRLLDEMRERALTIQQARPIEGTVVREDPAPYRTKNMNRQDTKVAKDRGGKEREA